MTRIELLATIALLAAGTIGAPAAFAQGAAPAVALPDAPAAAPALKKGPMDKVVCRTEDTMGSRLGGHRVCHTAAEWRQMSRDEQDNLDQRMRRPHQEQGG